jgi:tetratricopeptide (TPR) repeat protein
MPFPARRPAQTALLYHDLGTAERNLGNSAKALEYLGLSLKTNLADKDFAEAASDYYMMASVYSRDGKYDEALTNAGLALSYDKQVESSPGIVKDLYALGLISSKKGDQDSAFDYFQRSYLVSTSMGFRDDVKKALAGLVAAADALGRTADAETYRKALADLESSPSATGSS